MGHLRVAHPPWGMSMIMPIVGNTDGELWSGHVYFGQGHCPVSVANFWGYYGDWSRVCVPPQEDLVSAGITSEPTYGTKFGVSLYYDPWTGENRE